MNLQLAKSYRKKAVKLYLESKEKERSLIEEWQKKR